MEGITSDEVPGQVRYMLSDVTITISHSVCFSPSANALIGFHLNEQPIFIFDLMIFLFKWMNENCLDVGNLHIASFGDQGLPNGIRMNLSHWSWLSRLRPIFFANTA